MGVNHLLSVPKGDNTPPGKGKTAMEHLAYHISVEAETRKWADNFATKMIDRWIKRAAIASGATWILMSDDIGKAADWTKARWYEFWEFISLLYGYASETGSMMTDVIERMTKVSEFVAEEIGDGLDAMEKFAASLGVSLDDLMEILRSYLKGVIPGGGGLPDLDDLWPDGDDGDGEGGTGFQDGTKAEIAALMQELEALYTRKQQAADAFRYDEVARYEVEIARVLAELAALGVNL